MEKLLAKKGIKSVTYIDTDGIIYKYFYTDKLLANNIIIEFYEFERDEEEERPAEEEGSPKYETSISVCHTHKKICYEFTILFDTRPYVPTLYVYRMILDLVELIENSEPGAIIENLEDASDGDVNSNHYRRDEKLMNGFNDHVSGRINLVFKLIEQTKIEGN
jgi:hypothetical protein